MTPEQCEAHARWTGQDLFDSSGSRIGTIVGPGYSRKRFGTHWLLVETDSARRVLVPVQGISLAKDRLTLPYARTYVEAGPAVEPERPLSRADERRLCLHYGLESALPNSTCRKGCGLCWAQRHQEHRAGRRRAEAAEPAP
jgi:hypothetical protein